MPRRGASLGPPASKSKSVVNRACLFANCWLLTTQDTGLDTIRAHSLPGYHHAPL